MKEAEAEIKGSFSVTGEVLSHQSEHKASRSGTSDGTTKLRKGICFHLGVECRVSHRSHAKEHVTIFSPFVKMFETKATTNECTGMYSYLQCMAVIVCTKWLVSDASCRDAQYDFPSVVSSEANL